MNEVKKNTSQDSITIVRYTHPQLISRPSDAYLGLLKNWNQAEISATRQYKALLLDKEHRLIAKLSLPKKFHLIKSNIKSALTHLFDVAKMNGAAEIIIGQNSPNNEIIPTAGEKEMAMLIKAAGAEMEMPVSDQIILTESSYYSYKKNGH